MLRSYLPALVFVGLGSVIGLLFTMLNQWVGVKGRKTNTVKADPYECGLPSEVQKSFRFGISFYLVGMLFILFDIEVIFLYPVAVQLREFGAEAVVKIFIFAGLLLVAFVYQWRRGALEWK
jgi:NADH-quinone oxidoreductase subunit A